MKQKYRKEEHEDSSNTLTLISTSSTGSLTKFDALEYHPGSSSYSYKETKAVEQFPKHKK